MTGGQDVEGQLIGARAHALARARGRQADHRHDRGHEPLQGRRARADRRGARPRRAARGAAGAGRGRGRDRPDPRPGVRRREAPRCASAASCRSPAERVVINERVCEGCGDCGEKSNCLSRAAGRDRVRPQDPDPPGVLQQGLLLPRGRLPVVPHGRARASRRAHETPGARPPSCPSPQLRRRATTTSRVRMMGIGGTGVVTVNQVLGMAALIDGLHVSRPRPDRPPPEGRPGRLRPAHLARAARSGASKAPAGVGRPLPRLRPARRGQPTRTSSRADRDRTVAVVSTQRGADRPHGHRHRASASPSSRGQLDRDRRASRAASRTSTSTPSACPSACSATT